MDMAGIDNYTNFSWMVDDTPDKLLHMWQTTSKKSLFCYSSSHLPDFNEINREV